MPVPISPLRKVGRLGAGLLFGERGAAHGRHLAFGGGRGSSSSSTSFSDATHGSDLGPADSGPSGSNSYLSSRADGNGFLGASVRATAGARDVDMVDMDGDEVGGSAMAMQSSLPASSAMDLIKERKARSRHKRPRRGSADDKGAASSGVPLLAPGSAAAMEVASSAVAGGASGLSYSLPSPGFAFAAAKNSETSGGATRLPSRSAAAASPRLIKHASDGTRVAEAPTATAAVAAAAGSRSSKQQQSSQDDLSRIRIEHQRRAKMARAMKALYVMKIAEMDGDLHEVVPRLFIGR